MNVSSRLPLRLEQLDNFVGLHVLDAHFVEKYATVREREREHVVFIENVSEFHPS